MTQEINNIMLRDFEPPQGCLITISKTETAADLKHAKVFVSVLPESKAGTALTALRKNAGHIQGVLNKKLKMKYVPRIDWEFDETNIKLAAIDEALKND